MKKRIAIFTAVIFTVLCFKSTMVFAAVPDYCSNCGAKLVEYTERVGNWTEKHEVYTGYSVDGKPIKHECTIYCSVDRVARVCPNGCGVAWSEDKQSEKHTSTYCSKHKG